MERGGIGSPTGVSGQWGGHTSARPNWALAPEEKQLMSQIAGRTTNENARLGLGGFVVPPLERGPAKWRGRVGGRFGG